MNDEEAIRGVIETWARASIDGDVDTLARLMTPDVTFLTPGNPPMRGRDLFLAGFRKMSGTVRIEVARDIQEITVAGDVAYAVTHLTVTMTPRAGGNPVQRSGHVLSVFRKQPDGSWAIARDANMLTG